MKKYAVVYRKDFVTVVEANTPEEALRLAPSANWTYTGWFKEDEAKAVEHICCNACSATAGGPVCHSAPACPEE